MTRISAFAWVAFSSLLLAGCTVRFVPRAESGTMGQGQQDAVWVCHGNQNPRWHAVASPAADAHRRHGDAVSDRPREEGASCGNVDRRTDDDGGGDDDQNGDRDGDSAVWVCHGNQNPRWVRVAGPAAGAHRRHGDAVSSRPRATNSPCGTPDRRTDEGPDQDEERAEGQGQGRNDSLWVCHGNQNPRWMSLPSSAADAHRRHGDPVSAQPRDQGSPCENGNRDRGPDDDDARGQGRGQGQGQGQGQGPDRGRDEARGQDRNGDQGQGRGQGQGNRPDHAQDQGQDEGRGQGADEARGQGQDRDHGRDRDDERGPDRGGNEARDQGQGQGQGVDQGADEARDRGQGQGQGNSPDRDEAEAPSEEESFVWICHGNRNPRWQKVLAARADAHRRHGDRVSTRPQEDGRRCQEALR